MGDRSLRIQAQYIQKANNALIGLGLTKKEFAEARLQLSRSTVSNCLNGKPISKENFVRICDVLKLDWEEMAGLKTNTQTSSVGIAHATEDKEQSSKDITLLVNQWREQVKADIETRYGTMRIFDMTQPIGLGKIYTQVNILEKISRHLRKDIAELIRSCSLEDFDRFNFGKIEAERILGKEAVRKYNKLFILGKPGAGKTTFLKHLAIQCNQGEFQGDLVPFFVTLKDFAEAEDKPSLLDYLDLPKTTLSRGKNVNTLEQILDRGKALVLLDGLDEVLEADSKRVIREIEDTLLLPVAEIEKRKNK